MNYKFLISISSLLITFYSFTQNKVGEVYYVQTYSIDENNTVEFIKEICRDTNNIVVLDEFGSFRLNFLIQNKNLYWDNEEFRCQENLSALEDIYLSNQLYGYDIKDKKDFSFDFFYLKDSIFMKSILDSLNETNLNFFFNSSTNEDKDFIMNELIKHFALSKIDSLFLKNTVLKLNFDDLVKKINKNVFVLCSNYSEQNGINNFVTNHLKLNHKILIFLPLHGCKHVRLLDFNNHKKSLKKYTNFTLIESKKISSVKLSKNEIFHFDHVNIYYVIIHKLDICWMH